MHQHLKLYIDIYYYNVMAGNTDKDYFHNLSLLQLQLFRVQ